MKRYLKICSVVIAVIFFTATVSMQARADLFTDIATAGSSSFYGAGGYVYESPSTPAPEKALNLGYTISSAEGCGSFSLSNSLKQAFVASALNGFLRGMGIEGIPEGSSLTTVVARSPLLLMSYASPTMANTYMHVKNYAEKILSIQQNQCQSIQQMAVKDVGILTESFAKARFKCISDKLSRGETLGEAMEECREAGREILPLTATSDSQLTTTANLTRQAEQIAGMNPEESQIFESVEGNITVNNGTISDREPVDPVKRLYNKDVKEYSERLSVLVNGVGSGYINRDMLQKIYNETGVVLTPQVAVDLYNIQQTDPYKAKMYEEMLASMLALYKLNNEILKVENAIEIIKQKAEEEGNEKLAKLLDKRQKLELEREALLNREQASQATAQMALKIHQQRLNGVVNLMTVSHINQISGKANTLLKNSTNPFVTVMPPQNPGTKALYYKYVPKIPTNR